MRQVFSCVGVALAVALLATPSAQAAPLLRGFGGPAGFGTNVLPANDDGSTARLDLTAAFPGGLRFFGGPYTDFYVNNNGNITFNGPVFNYTPIRFPIADQPMIAPYWGDVDTRGTATPPENLVYWHLEPGRLIVTWHQVGYYGAHTNLRMDFQLIITNTLDCGSGDFDVEFRYNRCEWTTGDASGGTGGFGGTPAQAGFDAGNRTDFVEMPGSFTMDILNVCTTSNIGMPGVWQFAVRSGGVVCPDAGMPCTVPDEVGPCAVGLTQCIGRDIECQPLGGSSPETCDAVDNDCDGDVDDGDLCTGLEICADGICVPPCFEGGCDEGFTCVEETRVCVETACIDVTCAADERCEGGVCVGACAGIVCPHGQDCVSGRCIDACEAVTCGAGQVCRDGICIPACPCLPCPGGGSCNFDGTCSPRGCDIVICDPGFYCDEGLCHDGCEGVVCPAGQRCELQRCIDIPPMPDAGPPEVDAQVPTEEDAGTVVTIDSGTPEVDAGREPPRPSPRGCGCVVAPSESAPSWGGIAMLGAALAMVLARRRRR